MITPTQRAATLRAALEAHYEVSLPGAEWMIEATINAALGQEPTPDSPALSCLSCVHCIPGAPWTCSDEAVEWSEAAGLGGTDTDWPPGMTCPGYTERAR